MAEKPAGGWNLKGVAPKLTDTAAHLTQMAG